MAGRTPKNSSHDWIEAAQSMLVEEGIPGLKVDRLASRLGVSRGGFYHNFKGRGEFFDRIIQHWETSCRFLPVEPPPAEPGEAVEWLDCMIDRLIESDGYDHHFDLAVREWALSDKQARRAVERVDRERLESLQKFFEAIGYDRDRAITRARIFYYHQMGYYAIGVRQSSAERRRIVSLYLDILCGAGVVSAARAAGRPGAARAAAGAAADR